MSIDFWLPLLGHFYALGVIVTLFNFIAMYKYYRDEHLPDDGMAFAVCVMAVICWPVWWYHVLRECNGKR